MAKVEFDHFENVYFSTWNFRSDPEKQIALIDTYLSRMQSSTDKDRDFCTRIIRYRETLSHSIDQARLNGQHRQRFLSQTTTLNTLSSSPLIKREISTLTSINSNAMTTTTIPTAAAATTTTTTTTTALVNNNNNLSTVTQSRSNGTTLIQLPLAKQEELLNAVLKKLRHVNLIDLQVKTFSILKLKKRKTLISIDYFFLRLKEFFQWN